MTCIIFQDFMWSSVKRVNGRGLPPKHFPFPFTFLRKRKNEQWPKLPFRKNFIVLEGCMTLWDYKYHFLFFRKCGRLLKLAKERHVIECRNILTNYCGISIFLCVWLKLLYAFSWFRESLLLDIVIQLNTLGR